MSDQKATAVPDAANDNFCVFFPDGDEYSQAVAIVMHRHEWQSFASFYGISQQDAQQLADEINQIVDSIKKVGPNAPVPVPTCGTDPIAWTHYVYARSYLGYVVAGNRHPQIEAHLENCESHRRALEVFHTI